MKIHPFVAFFSILVGSVQAKGMFYDHVQDYWDSQNTSPLLLLILGFVLVIAVGILVLLEIRKADHFHRRKMEIGWKKFHEIAGKRRLIEKDRQDLEIFLRKAQIISADAVFSSPLVFENCLEAYLATYEPNIPNSEFAKVRKLRNILGYDKISVETPYVSTRQLSEHTKLMLKLDGILSQSVILGVGEDTWKVLNSFRLIPALKSELKLSITRFSDGEYSIRTEIVEATSEALTLKHTRRLTRKQLRNWVRVDISTSVKVKLISLQNTDKLSEGTLIVGKLSDISGGGVSLKIPGSLSSDDIVEIDFKLNGHKFKKIQGIVIRSNQAPLGAEGLYQHSVEFVDLESHVRERIIRSVFDKQRHDTQWR